MLLVTPFLPSPLALAIIRSKILEGQASRSESATATRGAAAAAVVSLQVARAAPEERGRGAQGAAEVISARGDLRECVAVDWYALPHLPVR